MSLDKNKFYPLCNVFIDKLIPALIFQNIMLSCTKVVSYFSGCHIAILHFWHTAIRTPHCQNEDALDMSCELLNEYNIAFELLKIS